jgi:hypothetical protein
MSRQGWRTVVVSSGVVALLLLGSQTVLPQPDRMQETPKLRWWQRQAGLREASLSKKPMFFLFTCRSAGRWGKRFFAELSQDTRAVNLLNQKFIPIRIESEDEPDYAADQGVELYPTVIVLSADGKLLKTLDGYRPIPELCKQLDRLLNQ